MLAWLIHLRDDIDSIRNPLFGLVGELLQDQVVQAAEAQVKISYVFMAGGFSGNDPLKEYVEERVSAHGLKAKVVRPADACSLAVARGTLLRSLNREDGPSRFVRSSFGIERHIEDTGTQLLNEGRSKLFKIRHQAEDGDDGGRYFFNCIKWFIHKVGLTMTAENLRMLTTG